MSEDKDALFKKHMMHYINRFQPYMEKAMPRDVAYECARAVFHHMQNNEKYLCDYNDELFKLAINNYGRSKDEINKFIKVCITGKFFCSAIYDGWRCLTSAKLQQIAIEHAIEDGTSASTVLYSRELLLVVFPEHHNVKCIDDNEVEFEMSAEEERNYCLHWFSDTSTALH